MEQVFYLQLLGLGHYSKIFEDTRQHMFQLLDTLMSAADKN